MAERRPGEREKGSEMAEAYFTTPDGTWFVPTGYTRGPWDVNACHAGPPTALVVRALERLIPEQRLARLSVELIRPIPMTGFRAQAEIDRPGRSVTLSRAEILDDDKIYVRVRGLHIRTLDDFPFAATPGTAPDFARSEPGPFPIRDTRHGEQAFPSSIETRYDPDASPGRGGPTIVWMRVTVPLLPDEEFSGLQRICPLADSGNGISYNTYIDKALFLNPDLTLALHRDPVGEWFASRVMSHWQPDGTGLADAELFDTTGPVGRAIQTLLLDSVR